MRVLFVNREMAMNPGGGETSELRFALALKKLGVDIKFIVGKPLFSKAKFPFKYFPVDYVASPYLRGLYQKLPFPLSIPVGLLDLKLFSLACLRYLRSRDDYGLIHALSVPQLSALKQYKKVPLVIRFPGPPSLFYKKEIMAFDAVIADGDAFVQTKKTVRKDVVEVPIGVDADMFKPSKKLRVSMRKKLGLGSAPVVLYTGRFMPIKNVVLLIQAMRYVVDLDSRAKLVLVGDGPLESRLRDKVVRLKLQKNVLFLGRVSPSDMPKYYAVSDVFCMPSLYDNFPNSVLEAMSSGLPVVATRVGGMPLQVKDGKTGFLVNSNDETALANKILWLLNNPKKAKQMGLEGRKWALKHFDWNVSAKKLKRVYEALLRKE